MHRLNIAAPELTYDENDPEGFRSGMFRMGKLLGASQLGATVYELPPGQAICPYHYEYESAGEPRFSRGPSPLLARSARLAC